MRVRSIWMVVLFAWCNAHAQGEGVQPRGTRPRGAVLPWITVGLDASVRQDLRPTLDSIQTGLVSTWRDEVDQGGVILAGLCQASREAIFFLELRPGFYREVLAGGYEAVPLARLNTAALRAASQRVIERTRTQLSAREGAADRRPALKVELRASALVPSRVLEEEYCLNEMLLLDWISSMPGDEPSMAILPTLGREFEVMAATREARASSVGTDVTPLNAEMEIMRPNRSLRTHWLRGGSAESPQLIGVEVAGVEMVLGQRAWAGLQLGEVSKKDWFEPLTVWARAEVPRLDPGVAPEVVQVRGAWAYLDRGRAWGLRMNDRVIATRGIEGTESGVVRGHVVGYFGADAGLKDSRGQPIVEGAIVFVREGQERTREGVRFAMDPQTFPKDVPP